MLRPLSGNRNEAPVFQAPRGCKGHTLFIVYFLFFSTVFSDLYPLSLSAIPGPSGERTVRIRKVKGSNPSVSTKQKGPSIRMVLFVWQWRDSNHVRTARRAVHEPVQTLANPSISFRRPSQGEKKCMRIPPPLSVCNNVVLTFEA